MLKWLISAARLDFDPAHRRPSAARLSIASAAAIAGSLLADAIVVAIGEAAIPATKDYVHFRFADYGRLTVIGVVIACFGWPIVARTCAAPRRLFCRLAVLVTLVLLLPDAYIWYAGSPATRSESSSSCISRSAPSPTTASYASRRSVHRATARALDRRRGPTISMNPS